MTSFRDWVVETSSTTGTSTYSLSGTAPAGTSYFTFRQRYSNGDDEVSYWVVNADRTKWEKNRFCTLTYGSPDTLTRNVVESTSGDAAISWVGGDTPLRLYVVPDADAEEFAISMGLGTTRPEVLKYGIWADENGLAADFDQVKFYDGVSDHTVGMVNREGHELTLYGTPPGFIYGLELSRSSATVIEVSAGTCIDRNNVVSIHIASTFTKTISSSWVSGTGNAGMADTVTVANNTWYHVFAGLADGVADVFIDTSVSGANAPSEFSRYRRLGSFKTDGSAQIIPFLQDGRLFQWETAVLDINATNPGTSAVTRTLASVPTGVRVLAVVQLLLFSSDPTTQTYATLSDLSVNDVAPSITNTDVSGASNTTGGTTVGATRMQVRTTTSATVRSRVSPFSNGNVAISINVIGWIDPRSADH